MLFTGEHKYGRNASVTRSAAGGRANLLEDASFESAFPARNRRREMQSKEG